MNQTETPILHIKSSSFFLTDSHTHYGINSSFKNIRPMHDHDFYEFFLMIQGKAKHMINNEEHLIDTGDLVFIRNRDIHTYCSVADKKSADEFRFINISILPETLHAMFAFIDDPHFSDRMLNPALPPHIHLSLQVTDHFVQLFKQLLYIPDSHYNRVKTAVRHLIFEFALQFNQRFTAIHSLLQQDDISAEAQMPHWLKEICFTLQNHENLESGRSMIRKLSHYSYPHICREFRKYLGVTPTEYINQLKLKYAANLLIFSDDDILSIALDAGFGNMSHFYHLFKRMYGVSPSQYRIKHQHVV